MFLCSFMIISGVTQFVVVVPHITDAIQDWVTKVSGDPVEDGNKADVCMIEVKIFLLK